MRDNSVLHNARALGGSKPMPAAADGDDDHLLGYDVFPASDEGGPGSPREEDLNFAGPVS